MKWKRYGDWDKILIEKILPKLKESAPVGSEIVIDRRDVDYEGASMYGPIRALNSCLLAIESPWKAYIYDNDIKDKLKLVKLSRKPILIECRDFKKGITYKFIGINYNISDLPNWSRIYRIRELYRRREERLKRQLKEKKLREKEEVDKKRKEYHIFVKRVKEEERQRILKDKYDAFVKRIKEEDRQRILKYKYEISIIGHHQPDIVQPGKKETDNNMEYKIKDADLRATIYEIVSGLSRANKKCNEWYLRSDLSRKGYNKGEIYQALKILKEKGTIYDIPYLDWFIAIEYRKKDYVGDNILQKTIFTIIKNFSIKFNWKYGIKQSDLFDKLLEKNFSEAEIRSALSIMRDRNIIFKKVYIYWFTSEYENIVPEKKYISEEDITEEDITDEDIKIEEPTKDVDEGLMEEEEDNKENDYSDIPRGAEDLTKRWKDLKGIHDKFIDEKEKEIFLQKDLERKREESINRQKELDTKIANLNKEKERLEKIFEEIRQEKLSFELDMRVEEKKVLKV